MARTYSTGLFKVRITGEKALQKKVDGLYDKIVASAKKVIQARNDSLYKEVRTMVSGNPVRGLSRRGTRNKAQGTGLEIMDLSRRSNVVGVVSGQLRANLRHRVSWRAGSLSGEVGFDSSFVPENPSAALRHALDWPRLKPRDGRTIHPNVKRRTSKPKVKSGKVSTDPVRVYVPRVLMGSDLMLGRNVLRMALLRDIHGRITERKLEAALKNTLGSNKGK